MSPLWRYPRRPSPSTVIALLALLVATSGIAYAAIPDGSGVIHGCYVNRTGVLRVIDSEAGQGCNPTKETSLTWSQTGPPGAPGLGATTFDETAQTDGLQVDVAILDNGVRVLGSCHDGLVAMVITDSHSSLGIELAGTKFSQASGAEAIYSFSNLVLEDTLRIGFHGIARDVLGSGLYARIDVTGQFGSPCTYSGMITPSN